MFVHASVLFSLLTILSGSSQQPQAGILILRNTSWDQVHVDLRMGPSTDCPTNPAVGTRTLKRGQAWTVVSPGVVCWRREAAPGDASQGWTSWNARQLATSTKQEVDL